MKQEHKLLFAKGFLNLLTQKKFNEAIAYLDKPVDEKGRPLKEGQKVISAPSQGELAQIFQLTLPYNSTGAQKPIYFHAIANGDLAVIVALKNKLPKDYFSNQSFKTELQNAIRCNTVISEATSERNQLYSELGIEKPRPPATPAPTLQPTGGREAHSDEKRGLQNATAGGGSSAPPDMDDRSLLPDLEKSKHGPLYTFLANYGKRILLSLLVGGAVAALFVTPVGHAILLAIGLGKLIIAGTIAIYEAVGAGVLGFAITYALRTLIRKYELGKKFVHRLRDLGQWILNQFAKLPWLAAFTVLPVIPVFILFGALATVGVILQAVGTFFGKLTAAPIKAMGEGIGEIGQWLLSPVLLVFGIMTAVGYALSYPFRVFAHENKLSANAEAKSAEAAESKVKPFPRYREAIVMPAEQPQNLVKWGTRFIDWSYKDLKAAVKTETASSGPQPRA